MDWDKYMDSLKENQENLEAIQKALSDPDVIEARPGNMRTSQTRTFTPIENAIINSWTETRPSHPLIGMIINSQISFNKSLIDMLTDLDYRKSEESDQ